MLAKRIAISLVLAAGLALPAIAAAEEPDQVETEVTAPEAEEDLPPLSDGRPVDWAAAVTQEDTAVGDEEPGPPVEDETEPYSGESLEEEPAPAARVELDDRDFDEQPSPALARLHSPRERQASDARSRSPSLTVASAQGTSKNGGRSTLLLAAVAVLLASGALMFRRRPSR